MTIAAIVGMTVTAETTTSWMDLRTVLQRLLTSGTHVSDVIDPNGKLLLLLLLLSGCDRPAKLPSNIYDSAHRFVLMMSALVKDTFLLPEWEADTSGTHNSAKF